MINTVCMQPESIQSMGGVARAEKLSAKERISIAARAAAARWADRPMKATHHGNFEKEFGFDVDCYVLDDALKTAVISQRGLGRALNMPSGGMALPRFLETRAMAPLLGAEISRKIAQPIKFQWLTPGAQKPPGVIFGFDVTLLIDLCRLIVRAEAEGRLSKRQQRYATQAHVILNASAKTGIKNLVYALAGYSPSAEEVITAFRFYVQEEAKKYEKEFPNELYAQWHRLYQIPVPTRGKPWQFKHLTIKHVYYPLAQSNGKILELMRALKAKGGNRNRKLFQFLSEVGARALRIHLGRVLEMSESSSDSVSYERRITERFGGQQELELVFPEPTKPSV